MSKQALSDVQAMSAAIAAQNARVMSFVDGLSAHVDQLVAAAMEERWDDVNQISRSLAHSGEAHGYADVSGDAQFVRDELEKPNNELGVNRSIIRLIGTCGRARRPRTTVVR